MEERKNNAGLLVLVTVLVMVVLGLVGFIVYDKVINKTNETNTEENNKVDNNDDKQEKEEAKPIEVTETLEKELRELIPTVKYCKQYLYKQYNGSIFRSEDLTEEDKTSNFEECQGALYVYTLSYKNESTADEVYLYDYVLLYDQQAGGPDKCQGCAYGTDYNNINIHISKIKQTDNGIDFSDLKEYGQIYKYTFKLVDGNYEYVSTEAVK